MKLKNSIKYSALLVVIVLTTGSTLAQEMPIQWGDLEPSSGRLVSLLPKNSHDFYTLRWSGGMNVGSYRLSHHQDFTKTATGKVQVYAANGMANYEDVRLLGNRLIVFLTDKFSGEYQMYGQEYTDDLKPSGDSKLLASFPLEGAGNKSFFQVISSRDNQFMAVVWEKPSKREEKDGYAYKVFDKELNVLHSGDFKLPFEGRYSTINEHHLANNGDYFISVSEFTDAENKGLFRNNMQYKSMHLYQITGEGLEDFEINLEGKRVEAMDINTGTDRLITLTGIYGNRDQNGVSGLFFLRVDFASKKTIDQGFSEFGKDFITQNWSDKAKERADRREQKGKGEPQLFNYVMRQNEILEDGSIVGSIEQYYVVVNTYFDPRTGTTRTTYTYYYNDIIAYKIGVKGNFDWLKRVGKYQVSTNDGGPYSSYARYLNNGKLCFVYNDNVKNYDDAGNYLPENKYAANFGKKKNVVGLAEIDIQTGDLTQRTFFDRKEIEALAVPKRFCVDYTNQDVLLYAIYGRKERFGLLKIQR
jgi:hypothetical protein